MARFSPIEGTRTLTTHYSESPRCKSLCIAAGLEGEIVGIGHTHTQFVEFFLYIYHALISWK